MNLRTLYAYIILTFCLIKPLPAQEVIKLPLEAGALQNTSVSFYAKYLDGGIIFEHNKNLRLTPASLTKLYTTAAALDTFAQDTKFETQLFYDGEINFWGTLNGNIYIRGGGDPALGSDKIHANMPTAELMELWANQIKTLGIKKINGYIYADSTLFKGGVLPPKVLWEDMGNYYAATSEALNINDNSLRVFFKPSKMLYTDAEIAYITPQIDGVKIKNYITVGDVSSMALANAYSAPKQNEILLRGQIPMRATNTYMDISIPNPPLFAAQSLKSALEEAGVKAKGAQTLERTPSYQNKILILRTYSPALSEIIPVINRKSDNMYAEVLLKNLSIKNGGDGSTQNGITQLENFLTANALPLDNLKFYDGSGLSAANLTSAGDIVLLLETVAKKDYFPLYLNSLVSPAENEQTPFSKEFFNMPLYENLRIKTGTMTGVRAYAGYLNDAQGRTIAFAFIANNYTAKTADISKIFNNLLRKLSALGAPQKTTSKK